MQKYILLLAILLCSIGNGVAQKSLKPCGTVAEKSDWLQQYQAAPHLYEKNVDTIIYVPLTIHLIGNDEGVGVFKQGNLVDALCTLNSDFEPSNIQFYIEGEINYLYNTAWYDHETVLEGAEMMFANNIENTLNVYFVSDPAGNCGYNLPYAGIAIAKSCAAPTDHTWSHEIGHGLSLPHPFLGWEGGVSYDGSIDHSFGSPAPTTVLYDYTFFQDTLILDTLIIDTAYVELVDGSNCYIAADGFCDTSPDYLASRWDCNVNLESITTQKDPNGETFRSDATLIMSYASDACSYRFSDEQIAAMRANLYDEKPHWLYNQTPEEPVAAITELIYPIEEEAVQYNYAELEWEAVPNATHYIVQIALLPSFSAPLTKTYVSNNNTIIIEDLLVDKNYYWKVRAYNDHNFCTEYSIHEKFSTVNMVAVKDIEGLISAQVFPSLIKAGGLIKISTFLETKFEGNVQFFNSLGVLESEKKYLFASGENNFIFKTKPTLSTGFYFIVLSVKEQTFMTKIVVIE